MKIITSMKAIQIIIFTLILSFLSSCGRELEQRFDINVTDEDGKPLAGVTCEAWFKRAANGTFEDYKIITLTDGNGRAVITGRTIWAPSSVRATLEGHYEAVVGNHWAREKEGNRWKPWPVELKMVMKKITNPKAMFAYATGPTDRIDFPDDVKNSYGYDLLLRDWVDPHGNGKVSDIVCEYSKYFNKLPNDILSGSVTIRFLNDGDGILPTSMASVGHSTLFSPTKAPSSGYVKSFNFVARASEAIGVNGSELSTMVWIFRIRTVKDSEEKVVSCHYGKISGYPQILIIRNTPGIRMTYFVNGTENDNGLEWDMTTNLFKDLPLQNWPKNP